MIFTKQFNLQIHPALLVKNKKTPFQRDDQEMEKLLEKIEVKEQEERAREDYTR